MSEQTPTLHEALADRCRRILAGPADKATKAAAKYRLAAITSAQDFTVGRAELGAAISEAGGTARVAAKVKDGPDAEFVVTTAGDYRPLPS
ncbi:MAG: hypothetical protein WEA10_05010 [Actinomycetota bacterium]